MNLAFSPAEEGKDKSAKKPKFKEQKCFLSASNKVFKITA